MDNSFIVNIGTIIGATIIALAPTVTKWWEKKSKVIFGRFNKNIETRLKIKEILTELLHRFQAQRVAIFNYHNGDYSRSGFPFDYVSIVYEQVDHNTVPLIENFQKLPISMFTELLDTIVRNEKSGFVMQSVETETGDALMQLKAFGVNTGYYFILTPKTQDGVLTLSFSNKIRLTDEDIQWVKYKVKELHHLQDKLHK